MEDFRALSEFIGCGLLLFDEEMSVHHANFRAGELFGIPSEKLLGRPLREIDALFSDIHGKPIPKENRPLQRAVSRREQLSGEEYTLQKDNSLILISLNTSPLFDGNGKIKGLVSDFTRCRQNEGRLDQFLGAMDEVAFEFDAEGHYLNVWSEDETLLKEPSQRLIGRRFEEFIPGDLAGNIFEVFRRVQTTGKPETFEYPLDVIGGTRWFLGRIALVPPVAGNEPTYFFLARDITKIKQLQRSLENNLHMLAHDLRVPLTIIYGHTEILRDGLKETSLWGETQENVKEILSATDRMEQMMEDLVEIGRLESGQITLYPDLICLRDFMQKFLCQQVSDEYHRVQTKIPADLPPVRFGSNHLARVMENLIGNALKYSEKNRPVEIEAYSEESQVCLTVKDYGQGIVPEELPHIFERFYRTSRAQNKTIGTGMGLYIINTILESYDSSIRVESRKDQGSTFTINIPKAD